MTEIKINSYEGIKVSQEAGNTAMGEAVPLLEITVSDMHSVGISDKGERDNRSTMVVYPLRLADGSLRPETPPEPKFNSGAHYLVRITGPAMMNDRYHQFDRDGNYLG